MSVISSMYLVPVCRDGRQGALSSVGPNAVLGRCVLRQRRSGKGHGGHGPRTTRDDGEVRDMVGMDQRPLEVRDMVGMDQGPGEMMER